MKALLKWLHLFGMAGFVGAVLAALVLAAGLAGDAIGEHSALRQASLALVRWVMVPSLLATIVSGMLLMVVHAPYAQAGWVWAKAMLSVLIAAAAMFGVQPQVTHSAAIAERARLAGPAQAVPAELQAAWAEALRAERTSAWIALGLSLAVGALGVWRPRLQRSAGG